MACFSFFTKKFGWTRMWSRIRFAAPQIISSVYQEAFQDLSQSLPRFSKEETLSGIFSSSRTNHWWTSPRGFFLRSMLERFHLASPPTARCLPSRRSIRQNLVATLETWGNERLKVPNLGSQPWNGRMKDGQFLSFLARTLLDFWGKLFLNLLVELELEDRRGSFKHWIFPRSQNQGMMHVAT